MKSLSVAFKDMLILAKDWSTLLQLFILPLVFIVLYVGIGTAVGGDAEEDQRIPIPVVNMDPDGELAQNFIDNLNGHGGVKTVLYSEDEAQDKLENEEIIRLLTIPAGFTDDILSETEVEIQFVNIGPDEQENNTVNLIVDGIARDLALQAQILAGLEQMREMQAANPDVEQAISADRAIEQAKWQFDRGESEPLIDVEEKLPANFAQDESGELSFAELAVPSMTVLFAFLTAQTTAQSVYDEKKVGSLRRLLSAPISTTSLMSGKMMPNFAIVIVQVIVVFFAAVFIFPLLGMDQLTLGDDPLALVLLVAATALCSTALGALISALARTEAQIGGLSTVILWVMAFVGGTIFPFFLVSDALAAIGKVTPQYWAVTGFYDLLVRGQGLADITDSLLALLGFSLIFFVIAIWRFDFD